MTVPTVLSNIAVPLLGLCDTAVAGHMQGEKYLAGIAIGSVMVSTVYWLFSFLRGGTSGLTANAFGADDKEGMGCTLLRSALLGIVIGVMIIAAHLPLADLILRVMDASPEVTELAGVYFSICVMGAIPMMILTALTGWMIGMQQTGMAMTVNIGMSILNVCATLGLVYGCGMGFEGIACGTLVAQWVILIPAVLIAARICRKKGVVMKVKWKSLMNRDAWRRMTGVNANLFFRSACLIVLTLTLYAYSARLGDTEVSSNAVINQLFLFFSYFMDGFAYTGEALIGRFKGASDSAMMRKAMIGIMKWGGVLTVIFSGAYFWGLKTIAGLLTDSSSVVGAVMDCRLWVGCLPLAGVLAFVYDGFYIGLTRTRPMLISTLCGVGLFMIMIFSIDHTQWMLWMSFTCYLALRSLLLILLFRIK